MPWTIEDNLTETDFRRLAAIVQDHCGIDLHGGKNELVRARISQQMRVSGFTAAREYLSYALADRAGPEFTNLIDALSTNLTSFFREKDHFTHLSETFLPALFERKRVEGSDRLRGWSAACSTGEEPYSIGMMMLDFLDRHGLRVGKWDIKLLATDISSKVLRVAEGAGYSKDRVAGVPLSLRNKYLAADRTDPQALFAIAPAVRQLIRFRRMNLVGPWPFRGTFDFILCRNVMIYFDKPTQQKLVNRLWERLEPGGLLLTGHSESLTGISHRFEYVQPTIYRKV